MIVIFFLKKLGDKKSAQVKFDNIPQTNEEYISFTEDCIRFIDGFRFLSSSFNSFVTTLDNDYFKILKK